MSSRGMNTTPDRRLGTTLWWRCRTALLVACASLTLVACDSVPTASTPVTGGSNQVLGYTGAPCGTGFNNATVAADACTFKVEFWDRMTTTQCDNCHDTNSGNQSPFFMESSNVNTAYTQALTIVNLASPGASTILSKIRGGHNCGDSTACNNLATTVEGYITNWANGGSVNAGANEINLVAPTLRDPGTSKTLPDAPGLFSTTVWPILTANCAGCHTESSPFAQSPFFAGSDVNAAYEAVRSSQKIDLDTPANSRLVLRLNPELHNCWDAPGNAALSQCERSANAMLTAINSFANSIPLSTVDPAWVVSKAMRLSDGILASGGARDDSSAIALYEFKSGSGSTAYDTSGIEPALDLTLFGTEGTSYRWVGGYGMQFVTGRAQGSAQNSKLRDRIVSSGEYSIEAWVVPGNVSQGDAGDPARIVSYSGSQTTRNFTLGQAEYRYEFMNRTSESDANGEPSFITDDADQDLQATLQHVVATFHPVNGRKIYVNGVDVATTGNNDVDTTLPPGDMLDWDNFALVLGAEAGGADQWEGTLRLAAIHNRALTQQQITQNFEAGVGQKFYLLFGISHHIGLADSFILFEVSQFDSYSYLFTNPTFISLDPSVDPDGLVIKGMRIGINGNEPAAGQAYARLDTTIDGGSYDAATGVRLSDIGTIIELKQGPVVDEFFLTFEQLGGAINARVPEVCDPISECMAAPVDGEEVSDIGLRTFSEINSTMAAITGVDPNTSSVLTTYELVEQQLPTVETIEGFLSSQQMAIAQLAIQYCDALVENATLRNNFFGAFGFTQDLATAYGAGDSAQKNQIIDALYDQMIGYPDGSNVSLTNMPTRAEFKAELIGPAGVNANNLFDRLEDICPTCTDAVRTRAVTKALCTSALGSAAMLIQ